MSQSILKQIVIKLTRAKITSRPDLVMRLRKITNQSGITPPPNSEILAMYKKLVKNKKIKENKILERLLRKREVRTLSGVAPVTVITKPYRCPGKCIYCPSQPAMPKSYLANEPAIMRAVMAGFDPFKQVQIRLRALTANGHPTDKIELIILGGTWSCYSKQYQVNFIRRCFDSCNTGVIKLNRRTNAESRNGGMEPMRNFKGAKTLAEAQRWNEEAKHRIVGITIETRPDYVTEKEVRRLRELGVTRVELGAQTIYDPILSLNKRGNNVKQIIFATRLLKQAGFKITYHMMPNLPGSDLAKDLAMFKKIFSSPDFQPDNLKIYPCVATRNSQLYKWWRQKKFKPYSDKQLKTLLIKIKKLVPSYVRINRLIRDIPAESIVAGNKITNLRQIIGKEFMECRCIRCREAGHVENAKCPPSGDHPPGDKMQNAKLRIIKYRAAGGWEYFISFESPDEKVLYAFLRLRINDELENNFITELRGAAIVRELHTYGQLVPIGKKGKVQHAGLGKKLMAEAEKICRDLGIRKLAVISGIGVRGYYKKLGYNLDGTYMVKSTKTQKTQKTQKHILAS